MYSLNLLKPSSNLLGLILVFILQIFFLQFFQHSYNLFILCNRGIISLEVYKEQKLISQSSQGCLILRKRKTTEPVGSASNEWTGTLPVLTGSSFTVPYIVERTLDPFEVSVLKALIHSQVTESCSKGPISKITTS